MPIELAINASGDFSVTSELDKRHATVILSADEEQAVELLFLEFSDSLNDKITAHIEKRSENYLSIVVCSIYDFCRFKISSRSKWFTLVVAPTDRKSSDKRFDCVKQKNLVHWKFPISSISEITEYSDIIKRSCDHVIECSLRND